MAVDGELHPVNATERIEHLLWHIGCLHLLELLLGLLLLSLLSRGSGGSCSSGRGRERGLRWTTTSTTPCGKSNTYNWSVLVSYDKMSGKTTHWILCCRRSLRGSIIVDTCSHAHYAFCKIVLILGCNFCAWSNNENWILWKFHATIYNMVN